MFQFPRFASCTYVLSTRYLTYVKWVSPFRDLRVKGYLPPHRSLSQAITSFIASDCQGIRRMRLFTWPYNPKQSAKCEHLTNTQRHTVFLHAECYVRRKFAWTRKFYLSLTISSDTNHQSIFYFYHMSKFLKNDSGKDQKSIFTIKKLEPSF